jgi:nucleotide-binding universal stress UspA family protein
MRKAPVFVVPVDFSPDMESTTSAAFALAKQCGADVDVLEVVRARRPSVLAATAATRAPKPVASTRDWSRLEDSIDAAQRAGIRVRTVAHHGDPIRIITAYVQLVKGKLIVIGQFYGTSRWRRHTRIVSTLSRAAPAPVLVLPPPRRSEKNTPLSFGRIVSAVDFTVASTVAVRTVLGLIRRTGVRLTLVHNVHQDMVFSGGEVRRVARNLKGRAAQVAEHFRKRIPANATVRVEARVTTGHPHHGILAIASEVDADLIVMGVAPRSRIDEVLFGSTLRGVLRRAQTPVLVVPVLAGAYRWLDESDDPNTT